MWDGRGGEPPRAHTVGSVESVTSGMREGCRDPYMSGTSGPE